MNIRKRLGTKETKWTFIILLIFLLSFVGIGTNQPAKASETNTIFTDIEPDSEYEKALVSLVQQQIIFGYSDGTYRPSEKLNRGQSAAILARALQLDLDVVDNITFSDVDESSWYYKSIASVVNAGIFQGYSDGTFKPDQSLTRAEMVKILVVAYQLPEEELVVNPFKDVSPISWYAPYLTTLIQNKITTGTSPTTYSPNDAVNRGEMALFIYRCQQLAQQPTERIIDAEVTTIASDSVQLGNESFTLTDDQKNWITPENLPILKNSRIKAQVIGEKISHIESITLYTNRQIDDENEKTNIVLTGNGSVIDATVIINGDNLSIKDITITKDLILESGVQNSFYAENVLVKGSTILSNSRKLMASNTYHPFILSGITNSHKPKLHFHHSTLQSIEVTSAFFIIELTDETKMNEINLLADASIEAEGNITIPIVRVNSSINVLLNARIDSLFIENRNSRISLRNNAKIENLYLESVSDVKLIFPDYELIKHKIIRINGVPNIDLQPSTGSSSNSSSSNSEENSYLIAAKNAVAWLFSDGSKTALKASVDQAAIDAATAKVALVTDGTAKSALVADLQVAQQLLNVANANLQAATDAVNHLFTDSSKTALKASVDQAAIDAATAKVALVADGTAKSALVADLQVAQQLLNVANANLQAATDAVNHLFTDSSKTALKASVDQAAIDAATAKVALVADGTAKSALVAALQVAQQLLNVAIANLQAATDAVNHLFTDSSKTALKASVDQAAIDAATAKVALVADGTAKSALVADLQVAQQLLNVAIANLQAATDAVNHLFTDSSKTALKASVDQAAIDAATAKVALVADGTAKSALVAALQVAQQLLNVAIANLQAATDAVNHLFTDSSKTALKASVDQAAIDAATAKVALVADGTAKSALVADLQVAQQLLNVAIANLQAATDAVNHLFTDSSKTALKASVDQAAIDAATAKVALVADGTAKSALVADLQVAQDLLNQILIAPTLTATAPNDSTVRFTFSDDAAWRSNITGIYLNGNSASIHSSRINTSTAGLIEIDLTGAALNSGTHQFLIKAQGYVDVIVTLEVPVLLVAPTLTATAPNDSTVRFTFSDDAAWRSNITGIYLNGNSASIHSSRINTSTAGLIEIDLTGAALNSGTHQFLIKAQGYVDVIVTLEVPVLLVAPTLTATTPNDSTVRFTFSDDAAWRSNITGIYLNGNSASIHSSRINTSTAGLIEIDLTGAALNSGTHQFLIKAQGYENIEVVIDTNG